MKNGLAQKRILIIEDQKDILLTLQEFLEAEGYHVEIAANGKEALEILSSGKLPNLILLDMKMPVMNGWQFAGEFLKKYDHQSPILVMTAAADAEQRAKEVSATSWLGKPFDLKDVLDRVKKYA